jgi:chloride channel protein, CIC family
MTASDVSPASLWSGLSTGARLLGVALLAAAASGLLAVCFQAALLAAERALIQQAQHAPGHGWIALTLLYPTLGGLFAGVVSSMGFAGARGSGVPQVKSAYALPEGALRVRDGAARFLLSSLQIGCGASLGTQGPTVHMCAALSGALGRWCALSPASVRRLLPVGAAAGVAAAFDAPLAAVAFVLEAIVGHLDRRLLAVVVPAAALAAWVAQALPGARPLLSAQVALPAVALSSLPVHALLGVLAGLVAAAFQHSAMHVRGLFQSSTSLPEWAKPAAGGLATGVCALVGLYIVHSGGVAGTGVVQLSQALQGTLPLATLLVLGALKFGATLLSFASGGSGGVFAPSLFISAMLGGALGWLGQPWLGADQVGAFTLVGMGACFAGMIGAPVTSVLISCELTGSFALLGPLVVASSCAHLAARHCARQGLYDALLAQDGVLLPARSR